MIYVFMFYVYKKLKNFSTKNKMVLASNAQQPFNYYVIMSSARHNRIIKTENKPFCGTCKNAGRPYSEYTSHFTKSVPGPHGIVTCPLILSAVCGNCQQRGHFTNFCSNPFVPPSTDSFVPSSNSRWQKQVASVTRSHLPTLAALPSNNVFDALNAFDDEFVAVKSSPVDEFPALVPVALPPKTWVSHHKFDPTVALNPTSVRIEKALPLPVLNRIDTVDLSSILVPSLPNWSGQKAMAGSWADYEDEEDDSDFA
jgi:hypothetical protein